MSKFIKLKTVHQLKPLYVNVNNIIAFYEEGETTILEITEYDMPVIVKSSIDNFTHSLQKIISSNSIVIQND
jgi:hypothetical protein